MTKTNEAEMKLLYTDIRTSLTEILTKELKDWLPKANESFISPPNSLSFEKERAVLECLSQQASLRSQSRALLKWLVIWF